MRQFDLIYLFMGTQLQKLVGDYSSLPVRTYSTSTMSGEVGCDVIRPTRSSFY
jgi:hypothetical protein